MTSGELLGLVLAMASALAFNVSYLLQYRGSADAPAVTIRHPIASLRGLIRNRAWTAGAGLGLVGMVLFWLALASAPLSLVQTFVTGGLVFCVPLATRVLRHTVTGPERIGVVLMAIALAALTIGVAPSGGRLPALAPAIGFVGGCLAVAVGLALARGPRRGEALGLASGVLFAAADLSTKVLTDGHSAGALLTSPWLLPAIAGNVAAFFAFSRGLQTGRPLAVIALMTAGTNVISIGGGVWLLGDSLGSGVPLGILHVAAFAVVGVAAWLLAPVQAALNLPAVVRPRARDPREASPAPAASGL
ncbi:MAG: hypothetical protein JWM71_1333 [Solirubrobacteraceae bacterium]|nr:hypothetical protein [Solirubrobacteraceae bacterium]